jgi:3alpha(or 20beta)-hydroxysteroid dehydrogenase
MADKFSLTGRKAVVTGAARGIGAAVAEAIASAGAAVVIADILDDLGRETAKKIGEAGVKTGFVHLDVSVDIEASGVRRMLDVNILGTLLGMKHAFRAMRPGGPAGKGGAVINISSVAATIVFPAIAAYSGTKSAVDRITRVGAAEAGKLGYGVRVNCIYPGLIPTEMGVKLAQDVVALGLFPSIDAAIGNVVGLTPLGRLAEVQDVADAAVFLASDAAKFITGAGLPVEGGMGS